jgi:hypothetical protein
MNYDKARALAGRDLTIDEIADLRDKEHHLRALLRMPQFSEYVKQHKLSLIDSRLELYDALLETGVLEP